MEIREAVAADLPLLPPIEVASGEAFREIGMPWIADDEPMPLAVLERSRVWVALDPHPVAWVAVEVVDGNAHVEQISVHPDHARKRIGAALLDRVRRWAADEGLAAVTLTTFRDVPWNAPYYRRLGFEEITEPTPGLRAVVTAEAARGLDPATRVCLRRPVAPPTATEAEPAM
ncbi:GNAT family N-acetyltransferase [Saccharothrix coeruleofusca]|uniref:GCN5 family N-acetyltransferase n=1 Tax=Saccharothrix coeruleofusca TaxID=33919 RepID=A0A918ATW5_9PSEU|nr:GNAT family N-acetyltransferase [Saccharothrix coeruleofusca]GGP84371.1 GCN5 family N-acetyltransferase [Saccharothrix coeruleofusca]